MDNKNHIQPNGDIINTVLDNLRRNNMSAQYVECKGNVAGAVSNLLNTGDTISVGGSVTLEETKVLDLVKDTRYHFADRYEKGLSPEEHKRRLMAAFTADVFLGSCIALDNQDMAAGCQCDDRRCCSFLILGRQRIKNRIKVILVGECLGF